MTRHRKTLFCTLLTVVLCFTESPAQVATQDSLALVALYHATDGPNWSSHESWLTEPVSKWSGIQVVYDRVINIDLSNSNLNGEIPAEIGNLTALQLLVLNYNQLSGQIPETLGSITSLRRLTVTGNRLTGSIPLELGNLPNLEILDLSTNNLSGGIPSVLGNLEKLSFLRLSANELSGILPRWLFRALSLEILELSGNRLTGEIPIEIGNLSALTTLYIRGNELTGKIPTTIGRLAALTELKLSDNLLTGEIPAAIGNLSVLGELDLSENQLVGKIPSELGRMTSLYFLDLGANQLTGEIPSTLGNLSLLETLLLLDNQLSGTIQEALGQISSIKRLDLSKNQLTGEIPDLFSALSRLQILNLSDNRLSGNVPGMLSYASSLKSLLIDHNSGMTGTLPLSLTSLTSMRTFWFDGTGLCEPTDSEFQAWTTEISDYRSTSCQRPTFTSNAVGECESPLAEAYLDANNVRARILNTGSLFYRGEPHVYNVPRSSDSNAIFAGSIWIAGKVNDEVRAAATLYGRWEFWAGPLENNGSAPEKCSDFDRFYTVDHADIVSFETLGNASPNLTAWPTGLGAPTLDADGNLIPLLDAPVSERIARKIDLEAGERPAIQGSQMLWWIMNDRGNEHRSTRSDPLGIEVHGLAFASGSVSESINNATLYKYRIVNRNTVRIENGYFGLYLDPDMGDFADDLVGSDSVRGIGYVYNADNFDGGSEGYGTPPPAVGVTILQGPSSDSDNVDNDHDGIVDEPGEHLGMTGFMHWWDGGGVYESPQNSLHYWYYLQNRWKNGKRVTEGGHGFEHSEIPTNFMFPGDPVTGEYWTERNYDGIGTSRPPGDRRFHVSTGPFSLEPGESTEIVFAIVWAVGKDHLDSINEMKKAADDVARVYEAGFTGTPAALLPGGQIELFSPADGVTNQSVSTVLEWDPVEMATNYQVALSSREETKYYDTSSTSLPLGNLDNGQMYSWMVRAVSRYGKGLWSAPRLFVTGHTVVSALPLKFSVVQNASGPLVPPDLGSFAVSGSGFASGPCPLAPAMHCQFPTREYQQSTSSAIWGVHVPWAIRYGALSDKGGFLYHLTGAKENLDEIGDYDFEWRWVGLGAGGFGFDSDGGSGVFDVGFELWNVGTKTPEDRSDDFRMIPVIDTAIGGNPVAPVNTFSSGGDHPVSKEDDPFTNATSWYNPQDRTPGKVGYEAFISGEAGLGEEVFHEMVLVNLDADLTRKFALPETGTVFRISASHRPGPLLAAPANGGRVDPGKVRFFWTSPPETGSRIQISHNPSFDYTLFDDLSAESGYSAFLPPDIRMYWRVQSTGSDWSDTWTFVQTERPDEIGLPTDFTLFDSYPNPFREQTIISFYLPEFARVRLDVHDILGRKIRTLLDAFRGVGRHEVPVDARSMASGMYFYTLQTEQQSSTKTMILSR